MEEEEEVFGEKKLNALLRNSTTATQRKQREEEVNGE